MNEEMNRHEAALNEAALEDAGGGYTSSRYLEAMRICNNCYGNDPNRYEHCSHRDTGLAKYMENGGEVVHFLRCPFRKEAGRA